ncbi:MAG: DUF5110 domain-containing protein [Clostridia bacterium]|nr:DUF5110 domain-containing protein [Clostridia bacterium]
MNTDAKNREYWVKYSGGKCREACVVKGERYRFSVLSSMLIRLEYSEDGVFEDRPSQVVLNRNLGVPEFHVKATGDTLEIFTEDFHLVYKKNARFDPDSLYIDAKNGYTNYGARWRFGETVYGDPPRHHNLYGTARTLDKKDGAVPLDFGIMDSSGRTFIDDSASLLFDENGWFVPRRKGNIDVYFFSYGRRYFEALKLYYKLTGYPPMLPRYALGNWWSRYYAYTADEYKELIERFSEEDIPLSVAVLDMDWHITKVDSKYGRGWTGYTWNRELFPDPRAFLANLHGRGLHCSLNLHPADGIQGFEDAYKAIAEEMGVDTSAEDPVRFDFSDTKFIDAYFDHLIHPLEDDGADIWWIDWQQGTHSGIKGLDPLWLLNHFHYLDSCRDGKRGMILSRYSGLGSQRYPLGFSGDTVATWDSLAFQPYFTSTAVNVGYPWWSHDIGGFKLGLGSKELLVRWIQFGVFSPIMRLHSSLNPYCRKEPWLFGAPYTDTIKRYMRLRYELIPYMYTMNYRCHSEGVPSLYPIYYEYPECIKAYESKGQYFFGSELMVCPITCPADKQTEMGAVKVWLPEGVWTDFFTGHTYSGGHSAVLNRRLEDQAVLAKAGAIVPLAVRKQNDTGNPDAFKVMVFPGGAGSFTLYEDSGEGREYLSGKQAKTTFELKVKNGNMEFSVCAEGDLSLIPNMRTYEFCFRGFEPFDVTSEIPFETFYDRNTRTQSIKLSAVAVTENIVLRANGVCKDTHKDRYQRLCEFLVRCELPVLEKNQIDAVCRENVLDGEMIQSLNTLQISPATLDVVCEIMFS